MGFEFLPPSARYITLYREQYFLTKEVRLSFGSETWVRTASMCSSNSSLPAPASSNSKFFRTSSFVICSGKNTSGRGSSVLITELAGGRKRFSFKARSDGVFLRRLRVLVRGGEGVVSRFRFFFGTELSDDEDDNDDEEGEKEVDDEEDEEEDE